MDTAGRILDVAERLSQTRGFEAVSFRDLAAEVGVKSASVHYHFPTKADLARAMLIRYRQRFETARAEIDRKEPTPLGRLRRLFALLADLYREPDKICLAAVFATDSTVLDGTLADDLRRFFEDNERWIAGQIERGVADGSITTRSEPACVARTIFAAVEGAILAARACADPQRIRLVGECLIQALKS